MTALLESGSTPGMRLPVLEPAPRPASLGGMRTLVLLGRTAWRRVANQGSLKSLFGRRKAGTAPDGARTATPRAKSNSWLGWLVVLCLLFGSTMIALNLAQRLDESMLYPVVGLVLLLMGLANVPMVLQGGKADLGSVGWDMEWLFTFPVPARTLFLARLVQDATINPLARLNWIMMTPLLAITFTWSGYGWWAVPLALAGTAYLAVLVASLCLVIETLAQKRLAAGARKNIEAGLQLAGGILGVIAYGVYCSSALDGVVRHVVEWLPAVAWANPLSLPVLLCEPGGWAPLAAGAAMLAVGIGAPLGAVRLAGWLVRDGLVSSSGAYQSGRARGRGERGRAGRWRGIVGKELRLLVRDRAFLTRSLVLPLVLCAYNLFLSIQYGSRLFQDLRLASLAAFNVGIYLLFFTVFQVLRSEGKALWLLYTVPQSLVGLLARKTWMWSGFAVLYVLAVFGVAALSGMPLTGEFAVTVLVAVGGIVAFAFIGGALGVLATNPLETLPRRQMRAGPIVFFLLLNSFFSSLLCLPSVQDKGVAVVIVALLAYGLWQKVQHQIAYVLEPAETAPPRLFLSDGMTAVLAFLLVQGTVSFALGHARMLSPITRLVVPFAAAVAVVSVVLVALRRVPDLLRITGLLAPRTEPRPGLWRAVATGLVAGVVAGLFGVAYMTVLGSTAAVQGFKAGFAAMARWDKLALCGTTVLVAPLVEEFLFRGLVFQGMRQTFPPVVAVLASAAVFALVHPLFSVLPVFVLGVAAVLSFRRTGLLLTPILAHLVYNTMIAVVWFL